MYAQNGTCCPHSPISTHIHVLLYWGSSLLMYYSQLLQVTPSAPTPASYAEWRPGEIYTDFHLLAKQPRNYRVVNTSVIMGAENLYFWLLTFVKKSFKNGFYSAKLLGKQPAVLYITHSKISRSLGESLVKCIVT